MITLLTVVFVGVEQGIILAIVLSLIDHTRHGYRPRNLVLVPNASGPWVAHPVASHAQAVPGLIIYRFTHSVYYANSLQLAEELQGLVAQADPPVRWLCIEASAIDDLDYSGAETLRSLFETLKQKGVRLVMAQVLERVKAESHYELRQLLGADAFFDSLGEVVDAYRRRVDAPR